MNLNLMPDMMSYRRKAITALRYNPEGFAQGSLRMLCPDGSRCALGVIADALGIPLEDNMEHDDPYSEMMDLIGDEEIGNICKWNDRDGLSFAEIADKLEETWNIHF